MPMVKLAHASSEVLSIEDAERLLERLDLLLPACNAVIVADTRINTRWLQLVEISKCCIQFLLCALKVGSLRGQSLVLVLLLRLLVLDAFGLCCNVDLRICHESVVLPLRSGLCCLRV